MILTYVSLLYVPGSLGGTAGGKVVANSVVQAVSRIPRDGDHFHFLRLRGQDRASPQDNGQVSTALTLPGLKAFELLYVDRTEHPLQDNGQVSTALTLPGLKAFETL